MCFDTGAPMSSPLTHFDTQGQAHMVDVAAKDVTHRVARASGVIRMLPATLALIASGTAKKARWTPAQKKAARSAAQTPDSRTRQPRRSAPGPGTTRPERNMLRTVTGDYDALDQNTWTTLTKVLQTV